MDTRDAHVSPELDGRWSVFRSRAARSLRILDTEKEAIALGRSIAKKAKVTLFIHRDDGSVKKMIDYSETNVKH